MPPRLRSRLRPRRAMRRAQLRGCARNPRFVSGHGFSHATTTPISIEAPQGIAKGTAPQPCEESSIRIRAWLQPCHHDSDFHSGPAGHCEGHSSAAVRGILDSYQGMASAMPPRPRLPFRPRRALRRAQLRSRARIARFVSGHGFSHATTTPFSIHAPQGIAKGTASRLCEECSIRIRAWLQPCHHNSDLD
jgi:hypothetical protein